MTPATSPQTLLPHTVSLVRRLQDRITTAFEEADGGLFERKTWTRPGGGGGEMRILRSRVLEKAAVNVSHVWGPSNPLTGNPFDATGISVIAHPANPKAPSVHMNVRAFVEYAAGSEPVGDSASAPDLVNRWVGGGMDLTPMGFPFDEDTRHFHDVCRRAVDAVDPARYEQYAKNAAEYFFIPHRNRERGVGGIFFDQVQSPDAGLDFDLIESLGSRFLEAYLPILMRRVGESFTEADRDMQLERRGHYAEFNLAYDRGTRFGFESGGNTEAILASMPPLARW